MRQPHGLVIGARLRRPYLAMHPGHMIAVQKIFAYEFPIRFWLIVCRNEQTQLIGIESGPARGERGNELMERLCVLRQIHIDGIEPEGKAHCSQSEACTGRFARCRACGAVPVRGPPQGAVELIGPVMVRAGDEAIAPFARSVDQPCPTMAANVVKHVNS